MFPSPDKLAAHLLAAVVDEFRSPTISCLASVRVVTCPALEDAEPAGFSRLPGGSLRSDHFGPPAVRRTPDFSLPDRRLCCPTQRLVLDPWCQLLSIVIFLKRLIQADRTHNGSIA